MGEKKDAEDGGDIVGFPTSVILLVSLPGG